MRASVVDETGRYGKVLSGERESQVRSTTGGVFCQWHGTELPNGRWTKLSTGPDGMAQQNDKYFGIFLSSWG